MNADTRRFSFAIAFALLLCGLLAASAFIPSRRGEFGGHGAPAGGTIIYTSVFSAGVDGWLASQGTVAGNIDSIGSQDDTLRYTVNAASSRHYPQINLGTKGMTLGPTFEITGDVYIPSSNSVVSAIFVTGFGSGSNSETVSVQDAWTTFTVTYAPSSTWFQLRCSNGTTDIFEDTGGDDVIYVRNVVVTELP